MNFSIDVFYSFRLSSSRLIDQDRYISIAEYLPGMYLYDLPIFTSIGQNKKTLDDCQTCHVRV
mgnify:CR=1 FL=1